MILFGVMTTQATWLAHVGRGVLIGQRECRPMTLTRESIDSPRARSDRLRAYRDKWQLALRCYMLHAWLNSLLGSVSRYLALAHKRPSHNKGTYCPMVAILAFKTRTHNSRLCFTHAHARTHAIRLINFLAAATLCVWIILRTMTVHSTVHFIKLSLAFCITLQQSAENSESWGMRISFNSSALEIRTYD